MLVVVSLAETLTLFLAAVKIFTHDLRNEIKIHPEM